MKYAILGPQNGISRVRDTAPAESIRHVELTDEQALFATSLPPGDAVWVGGDVVSRATVRASGDRLRWNDTFGELVRFTPAPPVPSSVPLWAFRQVLLQDGLLASIQAAVSSNAVLVNFLEYGNFVDRASPALAGLAANLGKSSEEVDDMFRRAGALKL